jgi:hypothetical protein
MCYSCGVEVSQIATKLGLIKRQVRYALKTPATPKKASGRTLKLDPEQRQILVDYVCSSKKTRRMSYKELAGNFFHWDVGHKVIKAALDRKGFSQRWAMRKPPISKKNRRKCLKFAHEHQYWTFADWCCFLWSDKTWVKDGRHRKTHILRRPREEWDDNYVGEKMQRKKG